LPTRFWYFVATGMAFQDKVALVTGGAQGIGLAVAERLAADGAAVAVLDVRGDEAARATDRIAASGGRAIAVVGDVAGDADARRAVAAVVSAFGGLDILVNNAGIAPMRPFLESTAEWFDRVMAVNVRGSFLMALECAREMTARRGGAIVQIASTCAFASGASRNLSAYNMSKAAVRQMVASLAAELAPRIRVNAVAPGTIDTEMTRACLPDPEAMAGMVRQIPLHALGQPAEVAAACAFLCSDEAAYITGHTLVVDGGWLVR
jgi:NAD(P)-dependent dehydrogenase (short-subunit alcohol dehydrogenase family)